MVRTRLERSAMADKKQIEETAPEELDSAAASELEHELNDDEILADLPELRPPHRLRLRHRNRIMAAVFRAERKGLISEDDGENALDERNPEQMEAMLEMLADIDEFAESIAVDKDAYVSWAEKNS